MKRLYMRCRSCCAGIIILILCAGFLIGCSGTQGTQEHGQSADTRAGQEAAAEADVSDAYWLIEASDTKKFAYAIPSGNGGPIDMTATLHFIAWKEGGEEMFGQYKGRALVAFDMDLSKAGAGGITYAGGVMEDSISDNISFELLPVEEGKISSEGEKIDLAPLVRFVGQAEILTDEYSVSQQAWKALADGQVKLDVSGCFGDGKRNLQGFKLKAGESTVLISVSDFEAAYKLDAFKGTISKADAGADPHSWYRDKVMSRMEERLASSGQSSAQKTPAAAPDSSAFQGGLTVDSEGREGIDTNGDGRLEIYFGEDGKTWADFDGDGKYEAAGEDGTDM